LNKLIKYCNLIIAFVFLTVACTDKKSNGFVKENDEQEENIIGETPGPEVKAISMNVADFVKWCYDKKNQLNKVKEISELKYNLCYMPAASMAFVELRTEQYDYTKYKETCLNYSEMTYFNLKIEIPKNSGEILKYNLSSAGQYDKRVRYISFDMQNDICIIQDKDTLKPGLYQFERVFEVAPYATVMLAFDNKKFKPEKEFTICYNDKLFDKGYVKFNYKNGQLVNLPNINGL
jgi:hypothetical protein